MDYATIEYSLSDDIARITLDRPDVLNAMDGTMRAELTAAIGRAADEARVLVLTGRGRGFCTGQDLAGETDPAALDLGQVLREEYEPLIRALTGCAIPTIAAVNGPAAGAGANLALAADVVIAAESAYFLQAFSLIGLIPDAHGTWVLPRTVGLARAMGMALFADRIPARQAADWGLIWEAVPDAEFESAVEARARQLAKGPTAAYRRIKQALRESFAHDLDAQLALEARLQAEAGRSADFAEGVRAFMEKRKPRFSGR